jgi:hypothetical protein
MVTIVLEQFQNRINELRTYDLEDANYSELLAQVRKLLSLASKVGSHKQLATAVCSLKKGERLYRAHFKHNDHNDTLDNTPTYIDSVLAPPAKFVKGFQRCNPPAKPMFYAATCPERSLRECRAETGDILFLSEWEVQEDLIMTVANPAISHQVSQEHSILFNFFADKFIQRVHDTFSFEYKLTSAITEVLIDINQKGSDISGICYPSVVSKKRGDNFALVPKAQNSLKLVKVEKIEILETTSTDYAWKSTEHTKNFTRNRINWGRFEQSVILPRNIPVLGESKDEIGWHLKLADGQIVRPAIFEERSL